jgi:hypothetical protein
MDLMEMQPLRRCNRKGAKEERLYREDAKARRREGKKKKYLSFS